MYNLCEQISPAGPFDACLACEFLGNGCSGPRTNAMDHERYVTWMKALKQKRGYSNQACAEGTGLSKGTIDDLFAGRRKTIARDTAGQLEDFLIGNGKWPCAMKLVSNKEVVYEDRPETVEALRIRTEQVENLRKNYEEARSSADREMERVRAEYEDDIKEYKDLVALLREQIARKDDYIDRLAKKAGI